MAIKEDTLNDLHNARNEMNRIQELSKEIHPADGESESRLRIIQAYASNELFRLDRLEQDIEELQP